MIFWSASEATANLLRHSLTENLFSVSIVSCDTPITVAPSALNLSVASAKLCASIVQPLRERGRVEVQHHRALLQRVRQRERERLAGERRLRREVRRLRAVRQSGEGRRCEASVRRLVRSSEGDDECAYVHRVRFLSVECDDACAPRRAGLSIALYVNNAILDACRPRRRQDPTLIRCRVESAAGISLAARHVLARPQR